MMPRVPSWIPEALLCAVVGFGPLAFGAVEPWSAAGLQLLCFALALACFLRGRPASLPPAADQMWLFPAAMAAYGVLQLAAPAAADGPIPPGPFTAAPHATEAAVRMWTAYAALLWSTPRTLGGHEAVRRFVRFLAGLGVFITALGVLQLATAPRLLYWSRPAGGAHPFGPYYNADHAANLLMMCLGVAVGAAFAARRRARRDGLPAGPGSGAPAALILAGMVFCGARGAFLAMPLAAAAVAFFGAGFAAQPRRRLALQALAAGGGLLVLVLAFLHVGANAAAGAKTESAVAVRFMLYADTFRLWRDAPLFGAGLGSFATVFPAYQDEALRRAVSQAHSDWLQAAAEAGALGVLGAAAFLALLVHFAASAWRAARSTEMRALVAGALASALAFAAHCLFEFPFSIPANAAVFFSLAGLLLAAPSWGDKEVSHARPRPPSFWAAALAVAGFLLVALPLARPVLASRGASSYGNLAARQDALARAYALDSDPRYLRDQAAVYYRAADEGARIDYDALRSALARSLAASELRPYDSDSLHLAATSLRRLKRPEDAAELLERALRTRFSPEPRGRSKPAEKAP